MVVLKSIDHHSHYQEKGVWRVNEKLLNCIPKETEPLPSFPIVSSLAFPHNERLPKVH